MFFYVVVWFCCSGSGFGRQDREREREREDGQENVSMNDPKNCYVTWHTIPVFYMTGAGSDGHHSNSYFYNTLSVYLYGATEG